jgi:hypothetical protein
MANLKKKKKKRKKKKKGPQHACGALIFKVSYNFFLCD